MKIDTSSFLKTDISEDKIRSFGIDLSGKAYSILSNDIYTDNPLAVLRELACNAFDSHIAAGTTDKPFEVWLPTSTAPNLIVKDYGVGLSHEAVMTLYPIYFLSDKNHSDEFTGGMGLGSKAPFAYTDQFTVISIHGGLKRTYSCFKNSKGIPGITFVSEEDTSEPTGLEVVVPAKPGDFNEALSCLQWFPTLPDLKGAQIPKEEWIYRTNKYGIAPGPYRYDSTAYVVMGNVRYKTDRHIFNYQKLALYIFVPINTFPFQVSRERLKEKIPELGELVAKIREDYLEHIKSAADGMSHFEQLKHYYNNRELIGQDYANKVDGYKRNFSLAVCGNNGSYSWVRKDKNALKTAIQGETILECIPGTKHLKVAEEHFNRPLLLRTRTSEKPTDWFPEVYCSSDFKVTKPKRKKPGTTMYQDIQLGREIADDPKALIGTDHPVQFFARKDGIPITSLNRYININEGGVIYVPETKPLKEKFEDHLDPLTWLRKRILARQPELKEYDFDFDMEYISTFASYKYNRKCIEIKKLYAEANKKIHLQNLIGVHPEKKYPYKRMFNLYLRVMNQYPHLPFVMNYHSYMRSIK